MNGVAHTILGAYIGSMAISSMQPKIPQAALIMGASVLGEILPDIENVHSIVGRRVPIISSFLNFIFGHRGLLHSPLFLIVLWFGLARFQYFRPVFCAGYLGHLVQDLFTAGGIPLFFPIHKKVSLSPFNTGGIIDYVITCILIAIMANIGG